jgi:hypothetical protein
VTCNKCGHTLEIGQYPFCPHERTTGAAVHDDSIPGGLLVPHAICHDDGTPKRYYSKSDIRKALRAKGYVIDGETPKTRDSWV